MNRSIRRVAVALVFLLAALFVNLNWVQVVKAKQYRNDPRNQRVLLRTYDRERGAIVVGRHRGSPGMALAASRAAGTTVNALLDGPKMAGKCPHCGAAWAVSS